MKSINLVIAAICLASIVNAQSMNKGSGSKKTSVCSEDCEAKNKKGE